MVIPEKFYLSYNSKSEDRHSSVGPMFQKEITFGNGKWLPQCFIHVQRGSTLLKKSLLPEAANDFLPNKMRYRYFK